jgi:hypothetical protein
VLAHPAVGAQLNFLVGVSAIQVEPHHSNRNKAQLHAGTSFFSYKLDLSEQNYTAFDWSYFQFMPTFVTSAIF